MTSASRNRATPNPPHISDWSGEPLIDAGGEGSVHHGDFVLPHRIPERNNRPSGPRPCVTIDLARLEAAGQIAQATSRSVLARTFRQLKLPLIAHARYEGAVSSRRSIITVTSAVPGEGKTFCAINLALSIAAEVDSSVLLIEADADRPDLTRRLGVNAGLGLFDLLTQPELKLADVALQTNLPKLEILPSGTPHPLPSELLSSNAMERLLGSLTANDPDRIVIFDAPSIIGYGSASVLASRSGQVVLVVEASTTPRRAVMQALAALDHCDLVMPLLNKARMPMTPMLQLPTRGSAIETP